MKFNRPKTTILRTAASIWLMWMVCYPQGRPGDLDPSFGNGGKVFISCNTTPRRVRVQPDGKIVTFGDYPYTSYAFLARNNSNGTPDISFSGGLVFLRQFDQENYYFTDFVTLPDGKYLVTGLRDNSYALFRFNANGTPDASFGTNGVQQDSFSGEAIAIQSDGKVIIGGYNTIDGVYRYFLARHNADGTLDAGFGENGLVFPSQFYGKIVLQPDGKILIRASDFQIARYNPNGSPDNTFRFSGIVGTGISNVTGIGFQSGGKIIVGGTINQNLSRIERYNDKGTLDTTFGTNGRVDIVDNSNNQYSLGIIRSLVVQLNNKILTAGSVNGTFAVHRFDFNGGLDSTFGTNGLVTTPMSSICRLFDITLQSDGKILAVGDASGPFYGVGLVRYLGDSVSGQESVKVSGRVLTPGGSGLRSASVTLTDEQGVVRTVGTTSLGFYSFENVQAGASHTLSVSSKRYRFAPRSLQLNADLANVDFVGME
jgi:uncharacterized delta-60 repeat protein